MKVIIPFIIFTIFVLETRAQYSFEKFPPIKYKEYKDWKGKENLKTESNFKITIPSFYSNKDNITIEIISYAVKSDSSYIKIYRNDKVIQTLFEKTYFMEINLFYEPLRIADINGDNLTDIKFVIPSMGNGSAAMNTRIIYLFQKGNNSFKKVSFNDKERNARHRPERDFNGDKNYEIITMTLDWFNEHSYFTFNLYNYVNSNVINVNQKYDYPIMIQFLHRENFIETNKITKEKMKKFTLQQPEELSIN